MRNPTFFVLLLSAIVARPTASYALGEAMEKMDPVYLTPDIYASFNGGDQALLKYIGQHNQAPLSADGKKIKGRVAVKFIIEADGFVREAEVFRGSGKAEVDSAGIAFVKRMPQWVPAIMDARPVRSLYIQTLHFK